MTGLDESRIGSANPGGSWRELRRWLLECLYLYRRHLVVLVLVFALVDLPLTLFRMFVWLPFDQVPESYRLPLDTAWNLLIGLGGMIAWGATLVAASAVLSGQRPRLGAAYLQLLKAGPSYVLLCFAGFVLVYALDLLVIFPALTLAAREGELSDPVVLFWFVYEDVARVAIWAVAFVAVFGLAAVAVAVGKAGAGQALRRGWLLLRSDLRRNLLLLAGCALALAVPIGWLTTILLVVLFHGFPDSLTGWYLAEPPAFGPLQTWPETQLQQYGPTILSTALPLLLNPLAALIVVRLYLDLRVRRGELDAAAVKLHPDS
ncbi:MAG: hypothetical protein WD341_05570 [Tistlia sp.]|uniref:hypothetical protein n=1 Tax=Tistlia sp. TaxID=3057121 RepID=UPI0034A2002A